MANANPCTARSFELCCKDRVKFPMCSASLSFLSLSLKNKQKKNQLIQIKKPGGLRRKHGPPPLLAGSSLDKKGFVENRQKDD